MPDLIVIIFLMLAAFTAGWVDAIGGGGGLIQFPALLFGLPNATPAQLLGMPWIVVVGKKLAEGLVEVKNRKTGERLDIAVSKIVSHLKSII